MICQEKNVFCDLDFTEGGPFLKTNIFELLEDFRDGIINSDTRGEAFEPEERFENPDGTSIMFDRDYFGTSRGVATIPGPVAEGRNEIRLI